MYVRVGVCVCAHSGVLLSHQKEGNPAICIMWIYLEGIMISEISQTEKDKYLNAESKRRKSNS